MTRSRRFELVLEVLAVLVAGWGAYWFAVGFGYNYGVDNQTTYLIGALKLYDPTLLTEDWVASECTPYHPIFSYMGYLLMKLDASGWSFAYANVALLSLSGVAMYWLCRLVAGRHLGLAAYFVVLTINARTGTHSVGVSYIVDFILQPSTLGGIGWLIAFGFFLWGRWLGAGVALAIGGLFHANYLLLTFPVFGFALLLVEDRSDFKALAWRLLKVLGPPMISFLLLSPIIFAAASHPNASEARELFFNVRSPHHYLPLSYRGQFMKFAAWQAMGLGALLPLLRGRSGVGPRLGAVLAGLAALIWTGTFLTTWVFIPRVAQVFVWRAAPHLDLLCQVGVAAAAARVIARPERLLDYPRASIPLLFGGLAVLSMDYANSNVWIPRVLLVVAGAVAGGVAIGFGYQALVKWTAPAGTSFRAAFNPLSAVMALLVTVGSFHLWSTATASRRSESHIRSHSTLIKGLNQQEVELFAWIRENTPKTARFLQPPMMERFRLHSQRAIVVDWKSPPLLPGEFLEWYERLGKVSGVANLRSAGDARGGYSRLDEKRVESLKAEFDVDFVVVSAGRERALKRYPEVYRNRRYVVLDVRSASRKPSSP